MNNKVINWTYDGGFKWSHGLTPDIIISHFSYRCWSISVFLCGLFLLDITREYPKLTSQFFVSLLILSTTLE